MTPMPSLSVRTVLLLAAAVPFGCFSCVTIAPAQAPAELALPGCEAAPEVRSVMTEKLDSTLLRKMTFDRRLAYQRATLEDLMARYPREQKPAQSYSTVLSLYAPEEYAIVRNRWVKAAADHPEDPLALFIAGRALIGKDTPQAIRLLEAARVKAPSFAWPSLSLAGVYATGKWADAAKTKANLETFFALCPGSTDSSAQWLLNKDQAFQPQVAAALRANLAKTTDPEELESYETLWSLEFRTHPPKEHDAVRAQVAGDLKRLEALNPHGDAAWESFLITGYKQSGASKEDIAAVEDRLLRDYPHSEEASQVADERWDKAHPKPEDQTDTAAWSKWLAAYKEALTANIHQFTDSSYLQHYAWFYAIDDEDGLAENEGLATMDAYLDYVRDYEGPHWTADYYPNAAEFLLEHKWQPARALDLMLQARAALDRNRAADEGKDNLSDEQRKTDKDEKARWDQYIDSLILKAALAAGKPEEAIHLKAALEGPVPADKSLKSAYWANRARLEVAEKHAQDALTYYQLALTSRTEAPKAYQGKLRDDLKDEAHHLWKAQGGTETAWALWSNPQGGAVQAAEGRWEKATKTIPDFELSDMSGKTWKLKDLTGKTVLINLWATWCGPCQGELPQLEKFYEKTKDRKDLQILTFDIDEDLGVLAPYLKEKGFTFPVLPAYSTVVGLLDGFAIPQTWLVDAHGVWQRKQIGFSGGSEADFEKDLLQQLDSSKGGQ